MNEVEHSVEWPEKSEAEDWTSFCLGFRGEPRLIKRGESIDRQIRVPRGLRGDEWLPEVCCLREVVWLRNRQDVWGAPVVTSKRIDAVSGWLGTPVISPVVGSRVSPVWSAPLVMAQV